MTKLLLIEDGEASLGESFTRPPLADAGRKCNRAIWNSFAFESLRHNAAELIVASGIVGERSRLLGFLHWLRDHSVGLAIIAVLPEDAEQELLHTCFQAADDCVLCPFRPEELRQRISRILGSDSREAAAMARIGVFADAMSLEEHRDIIHVNNYLHLRGAHNKIGDRTNASCC